VEKYFSSLHSRPTPPRPDVAEAPQTAERRGEETDKLARIPAIALGYRMPARTSPDAIVGAVTGDLLHNGEASILYQSLVKDKQVAVQVVGGDNWPLGNAFEYNGPTLMTSFIQYPPNVTEQQLLAAYDGAVATLATEGPTREEVERVAAKMRSDWYDQLEIPVNRAMALSHEVLLGGNFTGVYDLPDRVAKVTPEQIRDFAAKYLVSTNRTIINRVPAVEKGAAPAGGAQ
jgi:zinc protease